MPMRCAPGPSDALCRGGCTLSPEFIRAGLYVLSVQFQVERSGHGGPPHLTREDLLLRYVAPVQIAVVAMVWTQRRALQRYTGEDAMRTGIREDLGAHQN